MADEKKDEQIVLWGRIPCNFRAPVVGAKLGYLRELIPA